MRTILANNSINRILYSVSALLTYKIPKVNGLVPFLLFPLLQLFILFDLNSAKNEVDGIFVSITMLTFDWLNINMILSETKFNYKT